MGQGKQPETEKAVSLNAINALREALKHGAKRVNMSEYELATRWQEACLQHNAPLLASIYGRLAQEFSQLL